MQHYRMFKDMVNDLKLSDDEKNGREEYNKSILEEFTILNSQDMDGVTNGVYLVELICLRIWNDSWIFDKAIENENHQVVGYPQELEDEMYELYNYIV